MLTQWPANCFRRSYKDALSRPIDTRLSPQRRLSPLTAAFLWGAGCLWRVLQWELVVITGPLVLSEMLSNQHSHYRVTWHLLPDKAFPSFPSALQSQMKARPLLPSAWPTEWSMAFIWLAWEWQQWNVQRGMCCVWGGKQPWVQNCVSKQNTVVV